VAYSLCEKKFVGLDTLHIIGKLMAYVVSVRSGKLFERYIYEERPKSSGRKTIPNINGKPSRTVSVEAGVHSVQPRPRRADSLRRSKRDFKRIVLANLGESNYPVFASLTYAENMQDSRRASKDFNTFARDIRNQFGKAIKYIAIQERQKRGAIHFHALIWGLPSWVVNGERDSRMVAGIWGHGFADLVKTDGDARLGSYMVKYLAKNFLKVHYTGVKGMSALETVIGLKW